MARLYRYGERGVTSLIVVLFSTLLFVVVAVGFMQLMTAEQRASADNELSRGAYDSALSGVEDGKRVLQSCMDDASSKSCTAIQSGECNTVSAAEIVKETDGEVFLQSNSSSGVGLAGQDYAQAYTCVKVARDTKDYVKDVSGDNSALIPLRTVAPVDIVDISWFARSNSTSDSVELDKPTDPLSTTLKEKPDWDPASPPVLRVQLMQYQGESLDLNSLDDANGHTVYLYPKRSGSSTLDFNLDARRSGTGSMLTQVKCSPTFLSTYACKASITLPVAVGGPASTSMIAYLRITPIYNNAEISVMPRDGVTPVLFHDLQPSIDSTGRAADVFRRVQARVELDDPSVVYPRATVDITNNLCKVFSVTDSVATYDAGICN